jgi:hypothetical protein
MYSRKDKMSVHRTKKQKPAEMLSPLPGGVQARAEAEVGATSVDRLAWLLRLLNRSQEISTVGSEQERVDLEAQVVAFAKPFGKASGGRQSRLNWKDIWDLAQSIRLLILGMLRGASFEIKVPPLTYVITAGKPPIYIGHPKGIFRLAVARLIETEQQRIKVCARPGCGKLFVRRKRGLYCSRQCSLLEYFKRSVARHSTD